jgi:hypothetical protein
LNAATVKLTQTPGTLPPAEQLMFGRNFSDHMLAIPWTAAAGWAPPVCCCCCFFVDASICCFFFVFVLKLFFVFKKEFKPLQNLALHPASSVLHYALEVRFFFFFFFFFSLSEIFFSASKA